MQHLLHDQKKAQFNGTLTCSIITIAWFSLSLFIPTPSSPILAIEQFYINGSPHLVHNIQ